MIAVEKSELGSSKIIFYIYNEDTTYFERNEVFSDKKLLEFTDNSISIVEVYINDFNNDQKIDLLLVVESTTQVSPNVITRQAIIYIGEDILNFNKIKEWTLEGGIIMGDITGSNIKTIMYNSGDNRMLMQINGKDVVTQKFENLIDLTCSSSDKAKKYFNAKIPFHHTSATIDIDGDCLVDLLIISEDQSNRTLEIWNGKIDKDSTLKYCLGEKNILNLPKELNFFSIGDFNSNGMQDLIFPINDGLRARAVILTNLKSAVGGDPNTPYCSRASYAFESFQLFEVPLDVNNDTKSKALSYYFVNLTEDDEFLINDFNSPSSYIRVADINSDSYSDITLILKDKEGKHKAVVLYNDGVKFSKSLDKSTQLHIDTGDYVPLFSSFFDLDENGQLDVIVVGQNSDKKYRVASFYDDFSYDSLFLKVITTLHKKEFTRSSVASTVRFYVSDIRGNKRYLSCFQESQLSSVSLALPYCHSGLGRTNSLIENFVVISQTFTKKTNSKDYSPIIPNSQILVSENKDDLSVLNWVIEPIMNPMSKVAFLVIIMGSIVIMLLTGIYFLHRKEQKEDEETEDLEFFN